ncbi:MAG: class I SAM-dependent methyltransferase [Armatimonadetes bacterium]|nr:class I SAM-dependent methyltransferase [Armatimonadota bacterium]
MPQTDATTEYYRQFRPEVAALVPEGCGRVLDVGCGVGVLGKRLKEQGRAGEVYGVEIVPEAAEAARAVLDGVLEGDIERLTLPFAMESFDCIVCADVLEHLADPWSVVARLHALLRPAGAIVTSLPNVGFHRVVRGLIKGRWEYRDSGVLDRTHLRFFTLPGILDLFEGRGFAVETIHRRIDSGLNMKMLNFLLAGRIRESLVIQYVLRARKAERPGEK